MPLHTRAGTSAGGAGDSNTGGGYGVIKRSPVGSDSSADEHWPYTSKTDLEILADRESGDEIESSSSATRKKLKRVVPSDRIGQLNYKTGAYVNGSTRGLTGIMSGMDPREILERIIDEVRPTIPRRSKHTRGMMRPIGLGASSSPPGGGLVSIVPGRKGGMGSKQGWFSPPPPKDSDPSNFDHAYSLEDIATADEERPLRHADMERLRIRKEDNITEKKNIAVLRSYVRFISRDL